jgi:hypothetical protein
MQKCVSSCNIATEITITIKCYAEDIEVVHLKKNMTDHDEQITNSTDSEELVEEALVDDEDKSSSDLVTKPWDPKDIRITTKHFSIREVYTQMQEEELDLAPDFQRAFVWKDKQQVRLIESILLGIPLPAFYFNQDKDGKHQVIDGVQRLTTIKHFMSGTLGLKEADLEYLKSLAGMTYTSLDKATQIRFGKTQIVSHVIEPQTPDEVKYDIFNRVNTGGTGLEAQEIRHCMSKARSREFLRELVESPVFDQVMGRYFWKKDQSEGWIRNSHRMMDREVALRFCAFYTVPVENYARASSLDAFLLQFTRLLDKQHDDPEQGIDLIKLKVAFEQAMQNCYEIMGKAAFRRWLPDASRSPPFSRAIFESQATALAGFSLADILPYKEAIQSAFRALFLDSDYDNAVRFGTGSHSKVKQRLDMPLKALNQILPSNIIQSRKVHPAITLL